MCVLCVCVKVLVYSAIEAILQTFGELTYSLGKIQLQLFILCSFGSVRSCLFAAAGVGRIGGCGSLVRDEKSPMYLQPRH